MTYELIITEKPNAAQRIASALCDGKPVKKSENSVPYYLITHNNKDIVVACAVGHLYGVAEKKDKSWNYPVFDVEWKPSYELNKGSNYTRKYLTVLRKLAKGADSFTIATDYDIEGEVIGYNVLRFACKKQDANRMKFSTLTKPDIDKAYKAKSNTIDWGQANAGITRHELDWYYGINISRALMNALRKVGSFKVLSSGRVQGPALKILVDKEKEIEKFIPTPYWTISLKGDYASKINSDKIEIEAMHKEDKIFDKDRAQKIYDVIKDEKEGNVSDIKNKEFKSPVPFPFDLTSLQIEAHKLFKIVPKDLLTIAQNLYTNGYISYPRTSSQKLPKEIDYPKILTDLKKNKTYEAIASELLSKDKLVPNEGKKEDAAHPAVYPTGIIPGAVGDREKKVYDLIVKRFFAVFGSAATRETMTVTIDVKSEPFITKGTRTKEPGWFRLYAPYVKLEDVELPKLVINDKINIKELNHEEKETSPPKRYTAASIVRELEKRNLGTKATRATIVDSLYQRGYANEKSIQATKLGIRICEILEKYSPTILDEELTRKFEDEMELIREKQKTPEEVLKRAREVLSDILHDFKSKEKNIGSELRQADVDTRTIQNTIGKCASCEDGTLVIKRGKFGRFIACDNYPDCKVTFKIPQTGEIKSADRICEQCNHPMITVTKKTKRGARDQTLCINPDCPSVKIQDEKISEEIKKIEEGTVQRSCPNCKEGNLILRKSIYGQFLGCSKYPKCKYTENLDKSKNTEAKKEDSSDVKKKVTKKTTKKSVKK